MDMPIQVHNHPVPNADLHATSKTTEQNQTMPERTTIHTYRCQKCGSWIGRNRVSETYFLFHTPTGHCYRGQNAFGN